VQASIYILCVLALAAINDDDDDDDVDDNDDKVITDSEKCNKS